MKTDHSRAVADGAHSHAGPEPAGQRFTSFELSDFPLPTGREEEWRFSPAHRFQKFFSGELAGPAPTVGVETAPGVTSEQVGRDDERLGRIGAPVDRVAAAAWNAFTEATVLTVGAKQTPEQPTSVTITGAGGNEPGTNHLVIVAEEHSQATVVVNHAGSAQLAQTVEVDVRDGAQLTLVTLQEWDEGSVHLSAHRARVGRDAKLRHVVVTLGGDVVRITPDAVLAEPGGEVEGLGLYFTDAAQHQEHRLLIDHVAPNCISRVTYKGALQGKDAHAVWIGDVVIRSTAEGTDTYELNRNLVLTEGARADSVPNLEIETGEIEGAGHASATGRFDDEQMFYLRARGIPELEARRLVVSGFFAELINQIAVPSVTDRLTQAIEEEIRHTEAVSA
ncbi:Fe-S cluster assembly protein SufD [Georgenia satyanarayanai]|uniref:Fe-S cluster assembly protein SufD n=1 Tax=Georgenia satyanarayanai TaxID=860221 RepID=UPI00203D303B|nr:Fe-S cluster assembly protein SufD [Georgenia satyanarayanai]MCM3662026.1 Fe-S cluster assembly protein SufD [Georgenia satyanarayanai]